MGLRNLPTSHPEQLASLITCRPGQVSSMALATADSPVSATLFAFSAGEGVSEEAYEGDTFYLLVEGAARVTLPTGPAELKRGDVLMVPRGVTHALEALEPFKVLQVTLP